MTAAKPSPQTPVPPGYKQTEVGVIPEDWDAWGTTGNVLPAHTTWR